MIQGSGMSGLICPIMSHRGMNYTILSDFPLKTLSPKAKWHNAKENTTQGLLSHSLVATLGFRSPCPLILSYFPHSPCYKHAVPWEHLWLPKILVINWDMALSRRTRTDISSESHSMTMAWGHWALFVSVSYLNHSSERWLKSHFKKI